MPKTYQETESDIQEAIKAIQNRDFLKAAATARHFNVPYDRLRKRLAGCHRPVPEVCISVVG